MAAIVDESQLRWPTERAITFLSVVLNLLVMALAIVLIAYGGEWLESHPRLEKRADQLRLLAFALVLAPPAIAVFRNARRGKARGNAVRLSRSQIPEIFRILEEQCEKLEMDEIPELYLSVNWEESQGFGAYRRSYVVLSTRHLGPFQASVDTIAFSLGRQLGAIRLGHAKWWSELLLWYVHKLPLIGTPLQRARTLSHDRYGAFLSGGKLAPLIVLATGRHMSGSVDVESYRQQVNEFGGFWDRVSTWTGKTPPLARRVKALHEAGLLRLDTARIDDLARGS